MLLSPHSSTKPKNTLALKHKQLHVKLSLACSGTFWRILSLHIVYFLTPKLNCADGQSAIEASKLASSSSVLIRTPCTPHGGGTSKASDQTKHANTLEIKQGMLDSKGCTAQQHFQLGLPLTTPPNCDWECILKVPSASGNVVKCCWSSTVATDERGPRGAAQLQLPARSRWSSCGQ